MIKNYESAYSDKLLKLLHDVYDSDLDKMTLEDNYISKTRSIIIAVDDESDLLVGCTFVEEQYDYIRPNKVLFVSYVAVDENYRNRGIGRQLMFEVERICRERKYNAIEFTSANYRTNAHRFYKNLGFSVKKTTVFIKDILW